MEFWRIILLVGTIGYTQKVIGGLLPGKVSASNGVVWTWSLFSAAFMYCMGWLS